VSKTKTISSVELVYFSFHYSFCFVLYTIGRLIDGVIVRSSFTCVLFILKNKFGIKCLVVGKSAVFV